MCPIPRRKVFAQAALSGPWAPAGAEFTGMEGRLQTGNRSRKHQQDHLWNAVYHCGKVDPRSWWKTWENPETEAKVIQNQVNFGESEEVCWPRSAPSVWMEEAFESRSLESYSGLILHAAVSSSQQSRKIQLVPTWVTTKEINTASIQNCRNSPLLFLEIIQNDMEYEESTHTQAPFSMKLRGRNIHNIQNIHKAPRKIWDIAKPHKQCWGGGSKGLSSSRFHKVASLSWKGSTMPKSLRRFYN